MGSEPIVASSGMSDVRMHLEPGGIRITITESTGNKYTKRASILLKADSFISCERTAAHALIKMLEAAAQDWGF